MATHAKANDKVGLVGEKPKSAEKGDKHPMKSFIAKKGKVEVLQGYSAMQCKSLIQDNSKRNIH